MDWLSRIWAEHKRFILTVGAGLAGFLLLGKIISAVLGDAGALRDRSRKEMRDCLQLAAELRPFSRDKLDAEALAKQEASAIAKLCLGDPRDIPQGGSFTTAFLARRDRIYNELQNEARKRNIALPPKSKLDFPIADSDPVEKLAARWIHLGVAERILREAVGIGFQRVTEIAPLEMEFRPIPSGEKGVVFYPVRIGLVGEFAEFVRLFDVCQKEGGFLPLRLEALGPDPAGGIAGRLVATGLRLADSPPAGSARSEAGGVRRTERR